MYTLFKNDIQKLFWGNKFEKKFFSLFSESTYNVQYACYIGDGDSKTCMSIQDSKPHGDFAVTKKE